MNYQAKNIRTFIGAKNYEASRKFYRELDFEEVELTEDMCLFEVNENLGFYLQKFYVKDWIDNSMVFLEVDDIEKCFADLKARNLTEKYKLVRLSEIKNFDHGRQVFLHDPSGVLWHFCEFRKT